MPCTEAYKEHIEYTFNTFCRVVIRYAAINAWRDRDKRRLIPALLQFRFDEQPYKKLNNCRPSQRHTMTGNQKKISCFFALIFGIFKNRQYCAVQRGIRKKSSLPFGKSASCPWRADKEKMCPVCLAVFNFGWCGK